MSATDEAGVLHDPSLDTARWLSDLIASARSVLDGLASTQRFHARLLAQELGDQYDAGSRPIRELIGEAGRGRRAEVREVVRRHLVAAVNEGRIVITVGNLLAAEHAAAVRTCDQIAAATAGFEDDDLRAVTPLLRNAVSLLARALLGALELRVLAESLDDPSRAALLGRARDRWASLACRVSSAAITGELELETSPARENGPTREPRPVSLRSEQRLRAARPLAGRVVLALAEGPGARASIVAAIEHAGGSTVIVNTRAAALELLRWFRVDAIVAAIERHPDSLLQLPHSLDGAARRRPLCVALLLPGAAAAAGVAESLGYDAVVPLALAQGDAIARMLGAAIEARRLAASVR